MTRYPRCTTPFQALAVMRLLTFGMKAETARIKRDWVTLADMRTSTDDCRIALRALFEDTP